MMQRVSVIFAVSILGIATAFASPITVPAWTTRHGRTRTTEAKAKELRPMAAKVVTIARAGDSPAARSHAMSILANQTVVDRLFDEIGPHFADRDGGYTRIFKLGVRPGDGATICQIELIDL